MKEQLLNKVENIVAKGETGHFSADLLYVGKVLKNIGWWNHKIWKFGGMVVKRPPQVLEVTGLIPGQVNHTKDLKNGSNGRPPWCSGLYG